MKNLEIKQKKSLNKKDDLDQSGSAIVIAVFILVLLSAFVALALTRTSSEAAAVGNETGEGRTFYAAQGSLEMMTRNFNKVFETKLSPASADFNSVRTYTEPGLSGQFSFLREVDQVSNSTFTVIEEGAYAGLYATRDNWRLRTTATDQSGIQVELTRNIMNNRIPIFQFGIFYNDDLEFHPGPRFDFGGRVHSNGSLFLMAQTGLYFNSRVSAGGEVLTDTGRNGKPSTNWGENVFVKKGAGYEQLKANMGSALKTGGGVPTFQDPNLADPYKQRIFNPDMPVVYDSSDWTANEAKFGGNLLARQKPLDLPLKIASSAANAGQPLDYIELIKRGKGIGDLHNTGGAPTSTPVPVTATSADSEVTVSERYYNKTGIRISLADSKAKLPGCASGVGMSSITGVCGVRLDGASTRPAPNATWGNADAGGSRGYQPLPMPGPRVYQATRLNGERLSPNGREVWIKIELISRDAVTNAIKTQEVTEDILSLGVTEPAPCIPNKFAMRPPGGGSNYYDSTCDATTYSEPFVDSRSVIKLQRFVMPGVDFVSPTASAAFMKHYPALDTAYAGYNLVLTNDDCNNFNGLGGCGTPSPSGLGFVDNDAHKKPVVFLASNASKSSRIVPFPIQMFDSREGIYNSDINTGSTYGTRVPWAGVMSMIDVDVKNLKRFLDGEFNASMPVGTDYYAKQVPNRVLRSTDVPQNNGWVVYISDRRGDTDFDGEYDMEDIYGNNDGLLQTGENLNERAGLDTNYLSALNLTGEAAKYTADGLFFSWNVASSFVVPGYAASVDHAYYRRGVRLINGDKLPGYYDSGNSANTRGFTVASENGVYVKGNYNAVSIDSAGTPTPADQYNPLDTTDHIPASVVGDAVTMLSNYDSVSKDGWLDSKSFLNPYNHTGNRRKAVETFTRFAMLSGDAKSSFEANPNQGGGDPRLGGGVHNFKRFLEDWSGVRLNYCGSLINLYNARNNNGSFKVSNLTYSPPNRNWVFDSSFLDPGRLPPGTPYFQYVQTIGFQRTNN